MTPALGTVVLVEFDPTLGHEERGVRPCIAASDPAVKADQRCPLITVVPVTGTPGEGGSIDQGLELSLGLNQME